jgi:hypothetical protein
LTTNGIPAPEYGDTLYLRVYVKDNNGTYYYGPIKEYSVRQYCENQINKNSRFKDLCIAMLHYGAAAQINFNYRVDNLANASIVDKYPQQEWKDSYLEELAPINTAIVGTGDVTIIGKTLNLQGAISVNFYFGIDESVGKPVKAELLVWENVTGELTLQNVTATKEMIYQSGNNRYYESSDMIAAAELGNTIYACGRFTDSEGNVHFSEIISYSAEAYAANQIKKNQNQNLIALVKAMAIYSERAKEMFN